MPTLFLLVIAMQCYVPVRHRAAAGWARRALLGLGGAAMAAALALSVQAHGAERGAAAFTLSLMAAGFAAPFLASFLAPSVARLVGAVRRSRIRLWTPLGQRVQVSAK
ncbi:MAG: hypothetical protein V4754_06025 [Pseudomonadota bacterium]